MNYHRRLDRLEAQAPPGEWIEPCQYCGAGTPMPYDIYAMTPQDRELLLDYQTLARSEAIPCPECGRLHLEERSPELIDSFQKFEAVYEGVYGDGFDEFRFKGDTQ